MSRAVEIMECTECGDQVVRAEQDHRGKCRGCVYWEGERKREEDERTEAQKRLSNDA